MDKNNYYNDLDDKFRGYKIIPIDTTYNTRLKLTVTTHHSNIFLFGDANHKPFSALVCGNDVSWIVGDYQNAYDNTTTMITLGQWSAGALITNDIGLIISYD